MRIIGFLPIFTQNKRHVAEEATAAKSLDQLRDTWMYHAVSCFAKGRYTYEYMKEALDKDFFKFLAGFAGILTIAIVGILAVGYYEMQNGSNPSSVQSNTTQTGL